MIEWGVALSTIVYGTSMGAGLGLALSFVKWIANFTAGRMDKREAQIDARTQHLLDGLEDQVTRLGEECTTLRNRADKTEEELRESREQHAQCRKEVMELRGLIQGRGDARNDSARIVARDRVADQRKKKPTASED